MLYSEIIAVCSQIHTKHINTLCGQNVELFDFEYRGTYSYQWALKCYGYFNDTKLPMQKILRLYETLYLRMFKLNLFYMWLKSAEEVLKQALNSSSS
jgi:hypothetical protein